MEKVQELRAARAGKIDSLDALIKKMGADDYVENDVDTQVYDEIKKDVGDLDKKISRQEEVEKLKASLAKPVEGQAKVFATARKRFTKLKAFKGPQAEDNAYATGQWIKAAVFGDDESKQWCRDNGITITRAQSEGVNSAGGVLVPNADDGFHHRPPRKVRRLPPERAGRSDVLGYAGLAAPHWRSDCLLHGRKYRRDGKHRSLGQREPGGQEAGGSHPYVDRALGRRGCERCRHSDQSEIAYAFASKEDDCGFNGDGTSTYGGIRGLTVLAIDGSHNAGKYTAASGHNTFATLDNADLTNLIGTLPQYALPGAKFYVSQLGFAQTVSNV
jgi:hypothetical protein